jgi:hypothetical protein
MNKSDFNGLHNSLKRILLFFIYLFQWISTTFKLKQQKQLENKDPKEIYLETRKRTFLALFYEKTEPTTATWNANLDDAMRDPKTLAAILEDPDNELERKWRRMVLIEPTPRGNVFMYYDAYKQGFAYYCDNTVMPYDIMNAVAMKYVITFRCRDLFIDSNVLPKIEVAKPENEPLESESKKPNLPNTFAKFKSYNTSAKKVTMSKEDDKVINRFLHLGPVRNWSPIFKKPKMNPLNGFKTDMIPSNAKLSYQDYKKLQQQQLQK